MGGQEVPGEEGREEVPGQEGCPQEEVDSSSSRGLASCSTWAWPAAIVRTSARVHCACRLGILCMGHGAQSSRLRVQCGRVCVEYHVVVEGFLTKPVVHSK